MISKCPLAAYLALYRSSLSSFDFLARTFLALIRFAPYGNLVLRAAPKVPLLSRSRISAYLAYIILAQFALGSFGLMISVNQHWDCPVNRVMKFLVSLRYTREIIYFWDLLFVLVAIPRALCVCWRVTCPVVLLRLVVLYCTNSLELSFIVLSA